MPGQLKLEGTVLSTDATAETITISGDDDQGEDMGARMSDDHGDQGGDDQGDDDVNPAIVVHVPGATQFTVGQRVELIVTGPAADGSFTLVRVDDDQGDQGHSGPGDGNQQGDNSGPGSQSSGPGDGSGDGGDDSGHHGSDG
jgi:hypothetical protein